MIRHIVFMKFKPGTEEEKIAELEKRLGALPGVISEIKSYEFGRDVVRSERSCDFALVSAFEDLDSLKRYQVHPDHVEVGKLLMEICEEIRAADYEF